MEEYGNNRMKTLFGILIGILSLFSVKGQQIYQSKVVKVHLPNSAVKTSISEDTITTGTEESKIAAIAIANRKNYYKINRITLGFWDLSITEVSRKSLERKKLELVGLLKMGSATNIMAFIKTFNHMQFIIINYDENDSQFYRFYSEYHNDQNIAGYIQFKPEDINKATDLLTQFLNSMEFKS
ncbi:hypothetical protein [Pedobacter sp. L105]|uniref:hypothetical protein n=1 Tax=Pedobacter sp. L105 TaxID=1641871 RepID=UPI00131AB3A7|nr:hypothetical protein [Pedobacter sp. L105]